MAKEVTMEEAYDLYNSFLKKKAVNIRQKLNTTVSRFTLSLGTKKGAIGLDVCNTDRGYTQITKKLGVQIPHRVKANLILTKSRLLKFTEAGMRGFIAIPRKDAFYIASTFIPLTGDSIQSYGTLNIQVSRVRISEHVVARYLYREQTRNVERALVDLGAAFVKLNYEINETLEFQSDKKLIYNSLEREVPIDNGGVVIIKLQNPSEYEYHKMRGGIVTYLSKDMVMEHNQRAAESEMISVTDQNYNGMLNVLDLDFDKLQELVSLRSNVVGF